MKYLIFEIFLLRIVGKSFFTYKIENVIYVSECNLKLLLVSKWDKSEMDVIPDIGKGFFT